MTAETTALMAGSGALAMEAEAETGWAAIT
jgi:hypothetical protein